MKTKKKWLFLTSFIFIVMLVAFVLFVSTPINQNISTQITRLTTMDIYIYEGPTISTSKSYRMKSHDVSLGDKMTVWSLLSECELEQKQITSRKAGEPLPIMAFIFCIQEETREFQSEQIGIEIRPMDNKSGYEIRVHYPLKLVGEQTVGQGFQVEEGYDLYHTNSNIYDIYKAFLTKLK